LGGECRVSPLPAGQRAECGKNFISLDLVGGNLLPMCNDEPLPACTPDQAAGVADHRAEQPGRHATCRERKKKQQWASEEIIFFRGAYD
jgi:hypothetical protein